MSDIDEIKSRLNIVELIGSRVHLKKAGRNFKGLCPFHSEKTPSFIVSPDRQIFHCFGCGKGGSIIDFVMEFDHVDFPEALETLAEKAGVKLTRRAPDTAEGKLKQRLYEINHLASEFYRYLLTKHKLGEVARRYLKNRGISDKSINTFSLGYSPNSWDGLVKFLLKKNYDEKLLEVAGLAVRGSRGYYDRFRGRVMFTLKDHRGNVVGFAGRVMDPEVKEAKYINTSETPVYVKSNVLYGLDITHEAIIKANEAIVMEGELDVISSWQAGISNVVALKGSALTEGHVRLLRRFTERLAFALDSDLAGDAAARRGIELAESAGFDMQVVILPSGKDPDEAARQNPGAFKKAIRAAIPVYDYFISSAMSRFDAATAFGKRKISEELLPILGKIDNAIVQAHYVKKLADSLDVGEETVRDGLEKLRRKSFPTAPQAPQKLTNERTRPEKLELYLLAFILQGKTTEFYEELKRTVALSDVVQLPVRRILERLAEASKQKQHVVLKSFAASLPPELIETLDEAFLWDIADFVENEEKMNREWGRALYEFRVLVLKRKIQNEKDMEKLKALTSALADLEKKAEI